MNITNIQKWVQKDWEKRSTSPPNLEQQLLYLMEEIGEFAEAIRKLKANKPRT